MLENYYEFTSGKLTKFWGIDVKGVAVTVQYGKIGGVGKTIVKQLKSPVTAKEYAEKLISKKKTAGYQAVTIAHPGCTLRLKLEKQSYFLEKTTFKKNKYDFYSVETRITGVYALAEKARSNLSTNDACNLESCRLLGSEREETHKLHFSPKISAKKKRVIKKSFKDSPGYPWVEGYEDVTTSIEIIGPSTVEEITLKDFALEVRGDRLQYCVSAISAADKRRLKGKGIPFRELFGEPSGRMFVQSDSRASKGYLAESVCVSVDGKKVSIAKDELPPEKPRGDLILAWICEADQREAATVNAEKIGDIHVSLVIEDGVLLPNSAAVRSLLGTNCFQVWNIRAEALGEEVDLEFQAGGGGFVSFVYITKSGEVLNLQSQSEDEEVEDSDGEMWEDVILTLR